MNVSFTGIKNLNIEKSSCSRLGSYLTNYGDIRQGNKRNTDILIECDLTDSKNGNHLSDFKEALKKSGLSEQAREIDIKDSQHIKLVSNHTEIPEDIQALPFTVFKLNGEDLLLNDKKKLSLYTYISRLTDDITKISTLSAAEKQYAKSVNNFIHDEAVYFIDNIM